MPGTISHTFNLYLRQDQRQAKEIEEKTNNPYAYASLGLAAFNSKFKRFAVSGIRFAVVVVVVVV